MLLGPRVVLDQWQPFHQTIACLQLGKLFPPRSAGTVFDTDMDSRSTIDRAVQLHSQGRLQEAEALYRDHLHAGRRTPGPGGARGHCVSKRSDRRGRRPVRGGLAVQPDSPRLHAYLGEALRVQKRFDLAYQHLRQALTVDPTMAHAWNGLGLLAYDQGRYGPAETAYRHAIQLAPNSSAVTTTWETP